MDLLQQRLEALEQRTHTLARQLRWWRGLACGLLGLAVLTWALPTGTAQEQSTAGSRSLARAPGRDRAEAAASTECL